MGRAQSRWALSLAAALLLAGAAQVSADVQPGDTINKDNVDKVTDLISPGVKWVVDHGMTMKIVPTKKIEWDKTYKEATEKYSGQVKLAPDGRSLINHTAGLPFPKLDPNDPNLAVKIMWNYDYKPFVTDDSDLRNFDADTGPIGDGPMQIERHYPARPPSRPSCTTAACTSIPSRRLPNPDKVRGKGSLHPILEPFDLKGVGLTAIRYLDPDRQDDTWLYLPSLRRVRRLSSAQRSDALFGQDTDVDSYGGYAGQIGWFTWKFLGEKTIVALVPRRKIPGASTAPAPATSCSATIGKSARCGSSRERPSSRSTPTASACSTSTRRRT